ncbi:AbrB/MazE/SpoVT family DNA-binding domain-containing protein [Ralstonia holmesii]|uniref:AbrB/MazE/SpoVT family DNA-binding domain-containing protein n=1 Tax=Ralstonia holmesii TaxID=3058602 RepID=UPI003F177AC3
MKPTFKERQELRKEFADDVDRMLLCLQEAGFEASDDDTVRAWSEYSDDNCAGWLALPEDDAPLREILLKHLLSAKSRAVWRVIGSKATDGGDDLIVRLPSELFERLGWKIGDELSIERVDPDTLLLRRA